MSSHASVHIQLISSALPAPHSSPAHFPASQTQTLHLLHVFVHGKFIHIDSGFLVLATILCLPQ